MPNYGYCKKYVQSALHVDTAEKSEQDSFPLRNTCYEKSFRMVFELIASMNTNELDKTPIKPKNRNRNEENRRQIIDFIADNGISDAKSISKAIGLKPSRTRDYLKQLVDEGILVRLLFDGSTWCEV